MPQNDDLAKTTSQTTEEQDPTPKPAGRGTDGTTTTKSSERQAEATRGCD